MSKDWPIAKRSASMWYRDLCASVRLWSEPSDVQLAKMRQWQLNSDELRERFQLEWGEFRKLHTRPLPLRVAERLDWLAQLISELPPESDPDREEWNKVRATARDVLPSMSTLL
jgi:hypothetical protein